MINDKPRLCGGTFFTLVLEARGQRASKRANFLGETDGLSEPEVLFGLAQVVVPDINEPTISMKNTVKGDTSNFKLCKAAGGNTFMLSERPAKKAFDERVKNKYTDALNAMRVFVDDFIEVGGSCQKDIDLVKALLELLKQDQSIDASQEFYVCESGFPLTKEEILQETQFCLDAFLLGMWHFALLRKEGNKVGLATANEWCPSQGGAVREYVGEMGYTWNNPVELSRCVPQKQMVEEAKQETEEPCVETEEIYEEPQPHPIEQTLNNPRVFNFNLCQTGNNNTQIGHIDTYYAPKRDS